MSDEEENAVGRVRKEIKISPAAHKRLMERKAEDCAKNVNAVILKYVPAVKKDGAVQ